MLTRRALRRRTAIVVVLVCLFMVVFVVRLIDLQVVRASAINAESLDKRSQPLVTHGTRGEIVDRNGTVLAESVMYYDINISPNTVMDFQRAGDDGKSVDVTVDEAATELAAALDMDRSEVYSIMTEDPSANFAYLSRGVGLDVYRAVVDLQIPWVYSDYNPGRIYPQGAVAGNIVGFVDTDSEPLAGAELMTDQCLASTDGLETYERGNDGVRIPGSTVTVDQAKDGGTTVLTLDSDLQFFAQQTLQAQVDKTDANWGIAVVMEVKTGKLVAVADTNTVDPNNVSATEEADRGTRAFSSPFEPGSTFKSITAAELIDSGKATPKSQVLAPNAINEDGVSFSDATYHEDLPLTLAGVLNKSSNTGISILGRELPAEDRYNYFEKFGLGQQTAVGFNTESEGILNPLENWDLQTSYATMFGQGVSATAIQIASVYQTLGNDGVRLPVQLIEGCEAADGTMTTPELPEPVKVVSEKAADQTIGMLESIITQTYLSEKTVIPGYRISAKTGTAQMAGDNGQYLDGTYLHSLVGLVPTDDPQYVVGVWIANPTNTDWAGGSALVFNKIMTQVLKEFRVQPSTEPTTEYPLTY